MKSLLDVFRSDSTPLDSSNRNKKGEWRPDYPASYAPVFVWPPQPLGVLKWIVGSPGYVWPVNLGLLLISALSWFYTQPALSRCVHLHWDWIAQIWLRNLALIWTIYGGAYLIMYILKVDGLKNKYTSQWPSRSSPRFLFKNQVYDNVFWTAGVAGAIWTAYEVVTMWMYANHHLPYLDWHSHPYFFVLWILVIPFWREFHFYWIHRFIHWKAIYKHVHYLHHKNVDVNPWSGMAMHPVESALYLSVAFIHWVIPSHPFHFLFDLQHAGLGPVSGHLGFEGPVVKEKVPIGSYFHYLHHRYFECNYGEALLPLDRWFGTYRDGLPDGVGSKLKEEHTINKAKAE
jgi:sterol desaturase/sphingolipid hydroxylase (fatty acid hydroxylase superfamily)